MPPKRGIVKTGNAGNSSKASPLPPKKGPAQEAAEDKPLFPPGSKYPLSLLHEMYVSPGLTDKSDRARCQQKGWHKPVIDTVRPHNKSPLLVPTHSLPAQTKCGLDFLCYTKPRQQEGRKGKCQMVSSARRGQIFRGGGSTLGCYICPVSRSSTSLAIIHGFSIPASL